MKQAYQSVQVINSPLGAKRLLFAAIRTAYSAEASFEAWVGGSFAEYEAKEATDGKPGSEVDRLIRHVVRRGHTSVLEHLAYTFAISGVSRSLLAQLTRHRVGASPTVQSQRYVDSQTGKGTDGFECIMPEAIQYNNEAAALFAEAMDGAQYAYDKLREMGISPQDARSVLPNAASTTLILTLNLRSLLHFYEIRHAPGAQLEIRDLAQALLEGVIRYDPWVEHVFSTE